MTDLKNDLGEVEQDLQAEKEKNLLLQNQVTKLKKELMGSKKTIQNYRKMVTDLQKASLNGTMRTNRPPSTISGMSGGGIGRMAGGGQRDGVEIEIPWTNNKVREQADDGISLNSEARFGPGNVDGNTKVADFLDKQTNQNMRSSAAISNSQMGFLKS